MNLFDHAESERRKASGMELAELKRFELLQVARGIAVDLCRRNGQCTADDVFIEAENRGTDLSDLGPASGSIFKPKYFEFTGLRVKSARKTNHARELKVWRLKHG